MPSLANTACCKDAAMRKIAMRLTSRSSVIVALCSYLFIMLLNAAAPVQASPVPLLQSERDSVWESAWETAWQIAWETPADFTVEFSGDVQGNAPLELVLDYSGADAQLEAMEFSWGAPQFDVAAAETAAVATAPVTASFGIPWAEERSFHDELRIGKLFVETTPANAVVRLLNADKGFSQGMDLSPGQYVLEVASTGYASQVRRVEIVEGMAATVRLDLIKADSGAVASGTGAGAAAAPMREDAATSDQLAKNLATPGYTPQEARPAAQQLLAHTAAPTVEVGLALASPATAHFKQQPAPGDGTLTVTTEPAGAQVRVLRIKPKYSPGMSLEPGVYTIDAQLFGYSTIRREVEVLPGEETSLHLSMEEAPIGRLFVKTTPENAYVRVLNIKPRFEQGMDLPAGSYVVDAHVSGYETKTLKVEVSGNKDNVLEMNLDQVKPTGKLFVDTQPNDAIVRVLGILPTFHQGIELAEGTYTIDATIDNSNTVAMQVEIKAGQDNRYSVQLPPSQTTGRLFVKTEPADATVRVLDIWPTFEQGMVLESGEYTLEISKEGYETAVRHIAVLPERDTTVSLSLGERPSVAAAAEDVVLNRAPKAPKMIPVAMHEPEAVAPIAQEPVSASEPAAPIVHSDMQAAKAEPVVETPVQEQEVVEQPVAVPARQNIEFIMGQPDVFPVSQSSAAEFGVDVQTTDSPVVSLDTGDPAPELRVAVPASLPQVAQSVSETGLAAGSETKMVETASVDQSKVASVDAGKETLEIANDIPERMPETNIPSVADASAGAPTQDASLTKEASDGMVFKEDSSEANIRAFDIDVYLTMANLALNAGDYLGAVESANHVLKLDAGNAQACSIMGKAYLNLAQYEDAKHYVDKGLENAPGNAQLQSVRQEIVQALQSRGGESHEGSQAKNKAPVQGGAKKN